MKASACLRHTAFAIIEPKRLGLTVAFAGHAAVLLVLLLAPYRSSPESIPIPVTIIAQSESPDSFLFAPRPEVASGFIKAKDKPGPAPHQARGKQGLVVAKSTRAPVEASHFPLTDDPNSLPHTREAAQLISSTAAATRAGNTDFVEQQPPAPTVSRRTDWQANPVEDKEVKYSGPGGAVQMTVREASSAGLLGTNFASNYSINTDKTSQPFSLAPTEWPTNTTAKSQKVEWKVVDSKNLGVTVFGYQNEVGSGFKPFGETKKEFAAPGTRTMKAGGQIRVGALSFGFAHSRIANTVDSIANFSTTQDTDENYFFPARNSNAYSAAKNEASVTLALPELLAGVEVSHLLPNLWTSVSNNQPLRTGSEPVFSSATSTASFGGTWNWDNGYATLGYWTYSSDQSPGLSASWSGRGFNANVGLYRSSFGIDAGLSYGQSEDAVAASRSAGALYSSYVTASYKPDKLPAIWVTAATGNYDYNTIASSVTSSDLNANLYADSSHGAYSSLTVGLDFKNWLWGNNEGALGTPYPSVKLLYRYTENTFFDNSAHKTNDANSLVAVMVQGKF